MNSPKYNQWFERLAQKRSVLALNLKDPAASGFWRMVVDKYAGQAHFLYELLQNADDACAAHVQISLTEKGVCFIHDGSVHFSITDPDLEGIDAPMGHVNSLTAIGASSKSSENQIGKFGIGFKSVFLYTDHPHVEDDVFSFALQDFIVPVADERMSDLRRPGETLFFLPFRQTEREKSYAEVLHSLQAMPCPLFFLSHLHAVSWRDEASGLSGSFSVQSQATSSFPVSTGQIDCQSLQFNKDGKPSFGAYRFSLSVDGLSQLPGNTCAVLYFADLNGTPVLPPADYAVFNCFFPIEESSFSLRCLLHAPFLLTENRERVKRGDEWNERLMNCLARLAADSLALLCRVTASVNLQFAQILDFVPLSEKIFSDALFAPFYGAYLQMLREQNVFLTDEGKYVDAAHTCFCSSRQLETLFSCQQFNALFPDLVDYGFCFDGLRRSADAEHNEKVHEQFSYLRNNGLLARELSLVDFVANVSAPFIASLSMETLNSFYALLAANGSLCSAEVVRRVPLILCADGAVRSAYSVNGSLQVYASVPLDSDLPVVHPELAKMRGTQSLMQALQITEPDLYAQIEFSLLPMFRQNKVSVVDYSFVASSLTKFSSAFAGVAFDESRRLAFLSMFADVPFLPAVNCGGEHQFSMPKSLYYSTADLRNYFGENPDVLFLDPAVLENVSAEKRESVYYFLGALGMSFTPRILAVRRAVDARLMALLDLKPKSLRRSDNGNQQVSDKEIDGFDYFVTHFSLTASVAFFRLLGQMVGQWGAYSFSQQLEGQYVYYEKSKKNPTVESLAHTTACQQIFKQCWLQRNDGRLVAPAEVETSDILASDYSIASSDSFLLLYLDIRFVDALSALAPEHKAAVLLIQKLHVAGFTDEQLERLAVGQFHLTEN